MAHGSCSWAEEKCARRWYRIDGHCEADEMFKRGSRNHRIEIVGQPIFFLEEQLGRVNE